MRIQAEILQPMPFVHDELGYAIGRETGGSAIESWRKGKHVPANPDDVERLAAELYRREGLRNEREVWDFLVSAGHPTPAGCYERIVQEDEQAPPTNPQPPSEAADLARVTVMIEHALENFTDEKRQNLLYSIAHVIDIPPGQIKLVRVVAGSVRATLDMPAAAAQRLLEHYTLGHPTLTALGIIHMERELPTNRIAAAAISRLHLFAFLAAVNMRSNGAAQRLWTLATEGLARLADPLLPDAPRVNLDDSLQQMTLRAYLEVQLERDPALLAEVARLLQTTDPAAQPWSPVQRLAVLVRQVVETSSAALGHDPAALMPTLHEHIRHQADPWREAMPRRWWRWPWQPWLQHRGDQRWHIRMASATTLALVRASHTDPPQEQAALADALDNALSENMARASMPRRAQTVVREALHTSLPQLVAQTSALRPPGKPRSSQPAQPAAATEPLVARQHGGVELTVASGRQRAFELKMPVPARPTLPVLGGHESLFSDYLPEIAQAPMVSVTLREEDDEHITLLVGISETFRTERWQVELLLGEQVQASATTNEVGIARFAHLPRTLLEQPQIALRCGALVAANQNQGEQEE